MPLITSGYGYTHITPEDIVSGIVLHVSELEKNNWSDVYSTVMSNSGLWNITESEPEPEEITVLYKIKTVYPDTDGYLIDNLDFTDNRYEFRYINKSPHGASELYIDSNGDGVVDSSNHDYNTIVNILNDNSHIVFKWDGYNPISYTSDNNATVFESFIKDNKFYVVSKNNSLLDSDSDIENLYIEKEIYNNNVTVMQIKIPSSEPGGYIEVWGIKTIEVTPPRDIELPPLSSDMWNSNYTTVEVNSGYWCGDLKVYYNKWNSNYTTVEVNSGNWDSVYTYIESTSGNLNSLNNTVGLNHSIWNDTYNDINSYSNDWNDSYTIVEANSGNWQSTYSDVSANSGYWSDKSGYMNIINYIYHHDNYEEDWDDIWWSMDDIPADVRHNLSYYIIKKCDFKSGNCNPNHDDNPYQSTALTGLIENSINGINSGINECTVTIVPDVENLIYKIVDYTGEWYASGLYFIWDAKLSTDVVNSYPFRNNFMSQIPSNVGETLPTYEYHPNPTDIEFEHSFNLNNTDFTMIHDDNIGMWKDNLIWGLLMSITSFCQFGITFSDISNSIGLTGMIQTSTGMDDLDSDRLVHHRSYVEVIDENTVNFVLKVWREYVPTGNITVNLHKIVNLPTFKTETQHITIINKSGNWTQGVKDSIKILLNGELIHDFKNYNTVQYSYYNDVRMVIDPGLNMSMEYMEFNINEDYIDINDIIPKKQFRMVWK